MSTDLSMLLPKNIKVVESYFDYENYVLFPLEAKAISNAHPSRYAEFVTARKCAHQALIKLGYQPRAIVPGINREPVWPAEIVGSITHCRGYRAAAVASSVDFLSIGIDAEVHEPLPQELISFVVTEQESNMLRSLSAVYPGVHWGRILFSAKESIYKSWFTLTHKWLDFTSCELKIFPEDGKFIGYVVYSDLLSKDIPIDKFVGYWCINEPHILTATYQQVLQ